jgi:hypothetical protein
VIGGRLWRAGHRGNALQIAASQTAKASLDAISIGTGLGHKLLPQRAGWMSSSETEQWRDVWESCNAAPVANS